MSMIFVWWSYRGRSRGVGDPSGNFRRKSIKYVTRRSKGPKLSKVYHVGPTELWERTSNCCWRWKPGLWFESNESSGLTQWYLLGTGEGIRVTWEHRKAFLDYKSRYKTATPADTRRADQRDRAFSVKPPPPHHHGCIHMYIHSYAYSQDQRLIR